jgi:metal-sulfur cluster biosynthetic enzyme
MTTQKTGRRPPLERKVLTALTTVRDPATPAVDIVSMGMVYAVEVSEDGRVEVDLAFSSPSHPDNLRLPGEIAAVVGELEGVSDCRVRVVTDPPWTIDRLSDRARAELAVIGGSD